MVDKEELVLLSSVTLQELEDIKTSGKKSEEVRYQARQAVRWLEENPIKYRVIMYDIAAIKEQTAMYHGLEDTNDIRILTCAAYAWKFCGYENLMFVSNDILARLIAKKYFELPAEPAVTTPADNYSGYKEVTMNEEEMAHFYENQSENIYDLHINEYLIIRNSSDEIVDKLRWNGESYLPVSFPNVKSITFGPVKPYDGDIYQQLAFDSFYHNKITMIKGPAGTGKSYLALAYMFYLLDKHKIEKIIIFANPTPTMNSAKLGFLPGTQLEKIIDSSCGNMLAGKLKDKYYIEQLVQQNKLDILPMCDIRGYDTSSSSASAVYITEAQNMDVPLMKLALQRIGENSICFIDGDYNAQVDLQSYSGSNNGMKRMSEVFRGYDFYGEVELKNIYRSEIAKIAELM